MNFHEKSAWACLASILGIWGAYFTLVLTRPAELSVVPLPAIILAIVLQIVVLVSAQIIISILNREGSHYSERDRRIALRSSSWAGIVLSVGVLLCALLLPMREEALLLEPRGRLATGTLAGAFTTGHLLLFWIVLSEVVNYGSRVLLYRRGKAAQSPRFLESNGGT